MHGHASHARAMSWYARAVVAPGPMSERANAVKDADLQRLSASLAVRRAMASSAAASSAAQSETGAATTPIAPAPRPKARSTTRAVAKQQAKRRARPRIDLDDSTARAQASFKQAAKAMAKARAEARNEKRKKARLYKKCSQLSALDLERIAVLKRSGLWDPNIEEVASGSALLASATGQAAPAATGSSDDRLIHHDTSEAKQDKHGGSLLDDGELRTGAEMAEDAAEINKE